MTNKKFYLVGMAVLLSVSLFFIGCPTEADPEIIDNSKTIGAAVDLPGLKKLLAKDGVSEVIYDGVLAIGTGELIVPAKKKLIVTEGVTLGTGKFIVVGSLDLGEDGAITVTGTTGLVIGDATAVLGKITGNTPVKGSVAASVTAAFAGEATVALVQNANGTDLTATNNVPAGKTLYVSDTLALGETAPTFAGSVIVLGTVSVSEDVDLSSVVAAAGNTKLTIADATLANTAEATVTLPATAAVKAIKVGSDDLTIDGAATSLTVGTLSGGAGKLTVPLITVTGETNLQGAAEFGGAATFASTLANSDVAALTFNGAPNTVTGAFTPGALATIAGTGAVTFTAPLGTTSANTVTIKNTGGVTLTAANTIADNIVATKVTITGDATTGVVIDSDAPSIVVPASASIAATAAGATIVAGASTNTVMLTGATLKAGTYTGAAAALTVANSGVVALAESGSLATAGNGTAVFGATTFGGVGSWTASATGGTAQAGVSGVSITSAATGASIALVAGSGVREAGILTAGGTDPTITQAAGASNTLTIATATEIVLGGASSELGVIKLAQGTNPGSLTLAGTTSVIYTLAAKTPGAVYSTLTSIDTDAVITGITKDEVFQASDKLTKLTGKSDGAVITGKAEGDSTNNIGSATVTAGS
jgi:hypothetical protein